MQELTGKVLVVTGAGGGIGRAIAEAALARGMKVVLSDIHAGRLGEAESALSARGEVTSVVCDVGDEAQVHALKDAAYAAFGAVHVLVNNAGIAYANSAWETSLPEYERSLRINLYGVIHGVRAFVPAMLAADTEGHIVNVASAAGLVAVAGLSAYSAAKFAVVGFSECLYQDLKVRNTKLSASVLCPSWVKTSIATSSPMDVCDAPTAAARAAVYQAVQHGIAAESVANDLLDAVVSDRFYVLTHDTTRAGVRVRSDDLLNGRQPTTFPIV